MWRIKRFFLIGGGIKGFELIKKLTRRSRARGTFHHLPKRSDRNSWCWVPVPQIPVGKSTSISKSGLTHYRRLLAGMIMPMVNLYTPSTAPVTLRFMNPVGEYGIVVSASKVRCITFVNSFRLCLTRA